jgi:SET domain-containing protein
MPSKLALPSPKIDSHAACFRMILRESPIHRYGVYAAENIPGRRKVIEYTGERISRVETRRRGLGPQTYLFTLDSYWTVDGSVGGSGAEYINHSCEPNLRARRARGHVVLFSLRPIRKGEELSWDYRFDKRGERVGCHCGSPKCRGTINLR